MARQWSASTAVALTIETTVRPLSLHAELEITLFRVAQSAATVKTHLLHIYEKLGVRDCAAVGEAYKRRLLS